MSIKFIAIAAITLDGKIAKNSKHMSDWTSKEDKIFMRTLLDKCDVIIVGNNTYMTALKPLSKRNCIVLTRGVNSPPFKGGVARAARRGGEKIPPFYCNPVKTNLKKIIISKNYKKIAILGGAQTYTFCLQNNMLDELYLTVEPLVFGEGINLFTPSPSEGRVGERLQKHKFKLLSIKKLNKQGSLLLHYKK